MLTALISLRLLSGSSVILAKPSFSVSVFFLAKVSLLAKFLGDSYSAGSSITMPKSCYETDTVVLMAMVWAF